MMLTKDQLRRHREYYIDQMKLALYDEMREALEECVSRMPSADPMYRVQLARAYDMAFTVLGKIARLPKE